MKNNSWFQAVIKQCFGRAWGVLLLFCWGALWLHMGCASGPSAPELPSGELVILPPEAPGREPLSDTTAESSFPREPLEPARHDAPPRNDPDADASLPETHSNEADTSDASPNDASLLDESNRPEADREVTTDTSPPFEPPAPDRSPVDRSVPEPPSPIGQSCRANNKAGTCLLTTDCTGNRQSVPGHCPGPTSVQCCVPTSSSGSSYCKVAIPASCQPVSAFSQTCHCQTAPPSPSHAGKLEQLYVRGCPKGMIKVDNFCIDRYEAVLVELLPGGQTKAWSPFLPPGSGSYKALSLPGVTPQSYISKDQAERACKAAGKRLCTDQEWLRACRSAQNYTYPYGNTKQKGWCNEDRSPHPAVEYFGHARACVFSYITHPCINQLPKSVAPTGSHSRCVTAEGAYDMMGNLHEWTATPPANRPSGYGTFRGGYYVDTYRNGNGCLYRTTAHTTGHWDYSTGFRCCAAWTP